MRAARLLGGNVANNHASIALPVQRIPLPFRRVEEGGSGRTVSAVLSYKLAGSDVENTAICRLAADVRVPVIMERSWLITYSTAPGLHAPLPANVPTH